MNVHYLELETMQKEVVWAHVRWVTIHLSGGIEENLEKYESENLPPAEN